MAEPKSSTSVMVVDPSAIEYPLDDFPEDRFNRLIPTETIQIPTDLLVPVVQVVRLSESDVYESKDMPAGHKAPKAVGLSKLATAASINFIAETRLDDGSNPDVCGVQVVAEMLLPTGARIRGTGTRWIDMSKMSWKDGLTAAQAGKFRGFLYEHTATRARNRAIRSLLSISGSYPAEQLRKPFAVVSFVPNMNHPEIRSRILDTLAPAIAAGFGPEAKQLAPGTVQQVPEAPDEDVVEGQSRPAADEPDWFAASTPAAAATPRIVEVLRQKASQSGLEGDITDAQKPQVQAVFRGDGGDAIPFPIVLAGLRQVWSIEPTDDGKLPLTAAQAQAIINCSVDDDFRRLWVEAFGQAAA